MKDIEKNIIKEANNSSFEFKEEYWDSALIKLQKSERQNIVKKFFWALGLLMLIAGGSYLAYQGVSSVTNKDSFETSVALAENQPSLSRSVESTNESLNTGNVELSKSTLSSTDLDNNLTKNSTLSSTALQASSKSPTPDLSISPLEKRRNSISKSSKSNSPSAPSSSKVISPTSPSTIENSSKGETHKNNTSDTNPVPSIKNDNTNRLGEDNSSPDIALNADQEPTKNSLPSIDSIDTSASQDSLPTETKEQLDSAQNQTASQVTQNKFKGKISFQAFVGGIAGGKMDGSKGTLINFPYAGLEIGYSLTPSLTVSSGLGYYQRKMNPLALSVTLNEFRFGLNQYQAKISLDQSTWLEVPIKFNYKLREGHYLSAGASASFLVAAKNSISTDLVFSNENTKLENSISEEYKKYRGFYNNSYSLQGSYQFYFKKLGIEINYHYGLNDIVKDDLIQVKGINRNSRLAFTLKYSIY